MASLSSVRIPPGAVPVLERLAKLDADKALNLVAALSAGEVRDMRTLKGAISGAVGSTWAKDEVDAFVGHLMSMSAIGASHSFSAEEFAQVITQRAKTDLDDDDLSVLQDRLAALLGASDFAAFSKATDIATEYDQVLHLSRIVSDIRPVFGAEAEADPIGAVIVHTLRIDYFHEGRVKTISFAMNTRDLDELARNTERANAKQRALSKTLERIQLPEFDLTGGDDE